MNDKEFSIGLLLPVSTILPIAKRFEQGLKTGLGKLEGYEINIVKEHIGQGGILDAEKASEKLLGYEGVELATGVLSTMVGLQLAKRYSKRKTPLLINNLGAQKPPTGVEPPYFLINTLHYWQEAQALCQWATGRFGGRGCYAGAVYDSGYVFPVMMGVGMESVLPGAGFSQLIAPMPPAGQVSDPQGVVAQIAAEQPDFVYAAFCGEEAALFLQHYVAAGLHHTTPLLGCPFLTADFKGSIGESVSVYTGISSYSPLAEGTLAADILAKEDVFYCLGQETGLLIRAALTDDSPIPFGERLASAQASGPRGAVPVDPRTLGDSNRVYLCQHQVYAGEGLTERTILQSLPTLKVSDPAMAQVVGQAYTGWMNPYLAI